MPIYDYHCDKCQQNFESYHPYADDEPEDCQNEDCDGKGKRIPHTSQNLKQPRYVLPPKAQKKFGERGMVPHRPARW